MVDLKSYQIIVHFHFLSNACMMCYYIAIQTFEHWNLVDGSAQMNEVVRDMLVCFNKTHWYYESAVRAIQIQTLNVSYRVHQIKYTSENSAVCVDCFVMWLPMQRSNSIHLSAWIVNATDCRIDQMNSTIYNMYLILLV